LYDVINESLVVNQVLAFFSPLVSSARVEQEDQTAEKYSLSEPSSEADWKRYFDLRWRVLRAPWDQPRGSERDECEDKSIHLMICNRTRIPLAIGRVHFISGTEAQIRFMAVEPDFAGRGFGSRILAELEERARSRGATGIVLNARREAEPFYLKHGYVVAGPAHTLFGAIEHVRMEKILSPKTE
jgi:GNAT superfamily N-acetyltransferase